jgi:hypothetical protein
MTTTTPALVPVLLTPDQLRIVHAALMNGADVCRDRQLHLLGLHESPSAGPVYRAEAWKAFKAWEARETSCCQAIGVIQAAAAAADVEIGFRDYGLR